MVLQKKLKCYSGKFLSLNSTCFWVPLELIFCSQTLPNISVQNALFFFTMRYLWYLDHHEGHRLGILPNIFQFSLVQWLCNGETGDLRVWRGLQRGTIISHDFRLSAEEVASVRISNRITLLSPYLVLLSRRKSGSLTYTLVGTQASSGN